MKKNTLITLLLLILTACTSQISSGNSFPTTTMTVGPSPTLAINEILFSGTITAFDNRLEVDGYCALTVGSYEVIINSSGDLPPGTPTPTFGHSDIECKTNTDLNQFLNKAVEVLGRKLDTNRVIISGKPSYYLKLK
jgi:hypothetical protein